MTDLHVVPADETRYASDGDDVSRPTPLLRELIGETLRSARRRQQRTLKDVAHRAGVSMTYLSEVERGRKEASSEVVGAITRALGGELVDLLTEMTTLATPAPREAPTNRASIRAVA